MLIVVDHMMGLMLPLHGDVSLFFLKTGRLGMTIFFVLSGFVMKYNYGHRFASSPRDGLVHFLVARFARLYPLLIVFVGLNFSNNLYMAMQSKNAAWASQFITTAPLFFAGVQSWLYAVVNNVNVTISQEYANNAWSISTEIFFYVLFIPLALWQRKRQPTILTGLSIVALGIIGRSAFVYAVGGGNFAHWLDTTFGTSEAMPASFWLNYYSPYGRFFEFLAGVGMAEIWMAQRVERSVALEGAMTILGVLGLTYIGSAFFNGILFSMPQYFEDNGLYSGYAFAIPFAIYLTCQSSSIASKIMRWSPLLFIGEISYSIYLVHSDLHPLFRISSNVNIADHIGMAVGRCAVFLSLTFIVSILCYRLIEAPARTRITEFFRTHPRVVGRNGPTTPSVNEFGDKTHSH
jgi:hypothetical protein